MSDKKGNKEDQSDREKGYYKQGADHENTNWHENDWMSGHGHEEEQRGGTKGYVVDGQEHKKIVNKKTRLTA